MMCQREQYNTASSALVMKTWSQDNKQETTIAEEMLFGEEVGDSTAMPEFSVPSLMLPAFTHPTFATKKDLQLVVEEVVQTLMEAFEQLMGQKLRKEVGRLLNEVMAIREEVSEFENSIQSKFEAIQKQTEQQLKRMRSGGYSVGSPKSQLSFSSVFWQQSQIRSPKSTLQVSQLDKVLDELESNQEELSRWKEDSLMRLEDYDEKWSQNNQQLKERIDSYQRKQRALNQHFQQRVDELSSSQHIEQLVVQKTKKQLTAVTQELKVTQKDILRLSRRVCSLQKGGLGT